MKTDDIGGQCDISVTGSKVTDQPKGNEDDSVRCGACARKLWSKVTDQPKGNEDAGHVLPDARTGSWSKVTDQPKGNEDKRFAEGGITTVVSGRR